MVNLASYETFEEMHGRRSSLQELIDGLKLYSQSSVLYVCATTGVVLKLWDRSGWDRQAYDKLIPTFFEFLRSDCYRRAVNLPMPQIVIHRRQLLFLMKLAIQHCGHTGRDLTREKPGRFGTILLMANDNFHYGLYPVGEANKFDDKEKIYRVLAEFVPVNEYSRSRIENNIVRAHLMMTEYANHLSAHADYIDIPAMFESRAGYTLREHEALTFGLFANASQATFESFVKSPFAPVIRKTYFGQTAVTQSATDRFISDFSARPEDLISNVKSDHGANDFTVFRQKPLLQQDYGLIATDMLFVIDKFQASPYWLISDVNEKTGDRLRRLWGHIFEVYVNELLLDYSKRAGSIFCPNVIRADDGNIQICDGLLVEGTCAVVLEYKSSMFRADAKYRGDIPLLKKQVESKFVRDNAEKKKKGVEQLADAAKQLFSDRIQTNPPVDLSKVKAVYPLLITLDGIGSTLLMSRLLNSYFDEYIDRSAVTGVRILPLFCTDIEGIEVVSPYAPERLLCNFLQHWLDTDPKLLGTLLAFLPTGLAAKRNEFLDRKWRELSDEMCEILFPGSKIDHSFENRVPRL